MSTTIDEKVVEMRFDNKDFEKNVETSMGTLDKLKKSLKFDDAGKSFNSLEKASKGIKFSGLGEAVDNVKQRLSAMEIVGITALANIANSAVNAGKRMVESLTIDPVKQGFGEYELKMGSIQTIMASTGADLKTVNGYLDDLNKYADKTIYSFSDMTANIGKFTNSGVALEDAVKAIQGISNEAAVSGANAQEASRAMYNFAQALSAGYVKLIDWKSIENANMATVEFKQSLLDTALALGTVRKEGEDYVTVTTDAKGSVSDVFNATKGFNDALGHQWMTTEVLTQTLSNYSTDVREMTEDEKKAYEEKLKSIGYTEEQIAAIEKLGQKAFDSAQDVKTFTQLMDTLKEAVGSGWAQTFETIFGDFEEAKKLWSAVSKEIGGIIDNSSKARNELLRVWKLLGGRADLIKGFANIWKSLKGILGSVKEGFREVFPEMTFVQLVKITRAFKNFTENLLLNDEVLGKIKTTAKNISRILSALFSIGKQLFSAVINGIKSISGLFGVMGDGVTSVTGTLAVWIEKLAEWLKVNDIFNQVVNGTIILIRTLINVFKSLYTRFDALVKTISGHSLSDIFDSIANSIKNLIYVFRDMLSGDSILNGFKTLASKIGSAFGVVRDSLDSFKTADTSGLENFADRIKTIFKPLGMLFDFIKSIFSGIGGFVKSILPTIKKIFDDVADTLGKIKDRFVEIMKNATSKDILNYAASGGIIFLVKKVSDLMTKLKRNGGNFKEMFSDIVGNIGDAVKSISKIFDALRGTLVAFQQNIKANAIIKIAIAVAILTAALTVLSGIDKKALHDALGVVTAEFGELMLTMKVMTSGKASSNSILKMSTMMIALATAVYILASAMKKISLVDEKKLRNGIGAITVIVVELTAAMKILGSGKSAFTGSKALLSMSVSLYIISGAIRKLAKIDSDKLIPGIVAITVLIAELIAFTKLVNGSKLSKIGVGLIALAIAVNKLAKVIIKLSDLGWDKLTVGLAGFSAIMVLMTASLIILSKNSKGIIKVSNSLVVFGIAMNIVAAAFKIFSTGNFDKTANGIMAFAGAMGVIIVTMKLLQTNTKGLVKITSSLFLFSVAMTVIAAAFKIFSSISFDELIVGLAGFAGVMAIIVSGMTALVMINKYSKGMVKVSAAMLVFSTTMAILANVVKSLAKLDIDQVSIALTALGGAVGIIVLAALAFTKINAGKLAGVSITLSMFSASLVQAASAIKILSDIEIDKVGVALIAIAGSMSIMVGALMALNTQKGAIGLGFALIEISTGLILLATAMKIFGSMGLAAIIGSLVMLAGTFILISAAAKILSPSVTVLLKLAKSIILLGAGTIGIGAGMFLLATSLVTLGASAAAATVGLVGMIKGVIGLLPYFAESFVEMLSVAIKAIKKILPDIFDLIQETIKDILAMLRELVPDIAETLFSILLSIAIKIAKYAPKFVKVILDFLLKLIDMLGDYAFKIANAAVKTIFKILGAIGKALKANIELIRDTVVGLIMDVLASALNLIAPWLVKWVTGNNEAAKSINVLTEAQRASIEKSYEMAAAYRKLRDERNEAIAGVASEYDYIKTLRDEYNSYIDSNGNIIAGYEDRAQVIKVTLADAMGKEVEDIEALIDANGRLGESFDQVMIKMEAEAVLEANKEAYSEAIKNQKAAMEQYINAGNTLQELKDQLADADAQYAAIMETYNNTMAQGATEAAQQYIASQQEFLQYHDKLKEEVGNARLAYGQAQEAYSGTMQELANTQKLMAAAQSGSVEEMKTAMEELQYSFITAGNGTEETLKKQVGAYKAYYNELEQALKNGMAGVTEEDVKAAKNRYERALGEQAKFEAAQKKQSEEAITEQAKTISNNGFKVVDSNKNVAKEAVKETGEVAVSGMRKVGENMDLGLANSISDYSYLPKNAMNDMMTEVVDIGKKVPDEHSPSKVFYAIGKNIDKGLVNGIKAFQGNVETATEDLGNSAIDGMNETIAKMYDYLDDDINTDPVIRPVLDLTQASTGVAKLNGMLAGSKSMSLSAQAKLDADTALRATQNGINVNNGDVVSSILSLKKDISELNRTVGNMKVVMDTGALVGQISSPLDTSLGRQTLFKQRGI